MGTSKKGEQQDVHVGKHCYKTVSKDKTVDLKETKDLYGRLMVLARSSRNINQKETIENYEFALTPKAIFAPDGTILPCMDKL